MKDYSVSYYLDNVYHQYIVEAENEYQAINQVMRGMPEGSAKIMHNFKIERYYQPW